MNCDKCSSAHATQHITLFEGGAMRELHLCEPCARELNAWIASFRNLQRSLPPERVREALLCPACRHVNPRGWKFCSECGARRGP